MIQSGYTRSSDRAVSATVVDMIEEQLHARGPDTAVIAGSRKYSYVQLANATYRVATNLRDRGIGPGDRVAVLCERSFALAAILLGILKAGGAVVPLDPSLPPEQCDRIMVDAGVCLLITDRDSGDFRIGFPGASAVSSNDIMAGYEAGCIAPIVRRGALAYVVYTSGSTGTPKGIDVSHASMANYVRWSTGEFGLAVGERVLHLASIGFDVGLWEVFWPLAVGGCVVMAEPGGHVDSAYLVHEAASRRVAVMHLTPPMLRRVIREPGLRYCSRLRTVVVSSDTLPAPLLNEALSALGNERAVYHMYGVTEVSVESTCWKAEAIRSDALPSIGSPISDTAVYLLDEQMRPIAGDGTGELYIGGGALAWGYRNKASATAAAFVPDPFTGNGSRMYRTGDLARRLDGELFLVGRADRQIKARGQRIALGAIEAALEADASVDVAVVEADGRGGIDAFVLAADGLVLSYEALTDLTSRGLPAHAVPSAFYEIDEIPVTGNGKVDRRLLTAERCRRLLPSRTSDGGVSPLEATLCSEFAAALGLPAVGVDDDFFALGGHSLLALELVETLGVRHGLRLPIRAIFMQRTVRAIAGAGVIGKAETVERQRVPRSGPQPMASAQLDIWLSQHRIPQLAAYNGGALLQLSGPLNRERLAAAVDALIARHEMLRTRYVATVDGPRQLVDPWDQESPHILQTQSRLGPDAEDAFIRAELHRPFQLADEWPIRTWLIARDDDTHLFLMVIHHLAADGVSASKLLHDLAELYAEAGVGGRSADPDYLDVTLGHPMVSEEESAAWWLRQLVDSSAVELPTDSARPAERSGRGAVLLFDLPAEEHARVSSLAARLGTTPFVILQTAVRVLLWRLTGQPDLVTVIPVSVRPPGADGVIGHFTQGLLLRVDLTSAPSFRAAAGLVRRAMADALEHASTGVAAIAARRGHVENLQRVVVAMQAEPRAPALLGLSTRLIDLPNEAADFDLQFTFTQREEDSRLLAELRFDKDLFEPASVRRYWRYFRALLGHMLDDPAGALRGIEIADPANMIGSAGASGAVVPLARCCMPALFTAVARERPEAPALVTADRTMSYGELAAESDRLAAGLRDYGLVQGQVVGVLADRVPEAIIAMLGILRGGLVYLPMRSTDSYDRLRMICADSSAALVLDCTAAGRREDLDLGAPVLGLPDVSAARMARPPDCPPGTAAAYLIFTSGSTGRPKGVLVDHKALVNRLCWAARAMEYGPRDKHLQKTALDFDVSVAEILQPFTTGGSLVLASPGAELDPPLLLDEARAFGITVMHFVPSALKAVLDADLVLPGRVRAVMCSGEALPTRVARQLKNRHPWLLLHNTYGPTETTIEMTHHVVERPGDRAFVTIGHPIDNVRVRVLDHALRPQPPMVLGELYVSGVALAAGYLGQPKLTASRFVPDPHSDAPGERMYATGDICFYDETGLLHFVERADRQVKVRGMRLELGAIEAAITGHPAIRQCAVVVETADDGLGQSLTAYIAVPEDVELDLKLVREQALRSMPRYAIPDRFVRLRDIPLTPSGKLDRAAAAAAAGAIVAAKTAAGPESGEVISRVSQVWASVLGVDQVLADDDFFALGGHSLLAAQCTAMLAADFGVSVSVAALFKHPRLLDFCSWWAGYLLDAEPQAEALPVADRSSRLLLSRAQLRLWIAEQANEPGHDYDIGLGWLAPDATVPAVQAALAEVVAAHEILRTGYSADADGPYQRVHDGWRPDVHRDDQASATGRSLASRLLGHLRGRPFDLTSGMPPLEAAAGQSADGTVLVLNVHHIALDGTSVPLLTAALADALAGRSQRVPDRQYADFASWEARSGSAWYTEGLAYWLGALEGASALRLPPVDLSKVVQVRPAGRCEGTLAADLIARLSSRASQAGGTLFAGLLAAFAAATHCLTQQEDLVIGTDAANRMVPGTGEIIGFFVNLLPLRLRVAPDQALDTLLRHASEATIAGLIRQHVPFDAIVEKINPPRTPGRTPLIRAKLVLQGANAAQRAEIAELPDIDPQPSAKFDLLMAWEPVQEGLSGALEFASDAVTPAVAQWFFNAFICSVRAIADEPALTVAELGGRIAADAQSRLRAGRVLRRSPVPGQPGQKGV